MEENYKINEATIFKPISVPIDDMDRFEQNGKKKK